MKLRHAAFAAAIFVAAPAQAAVVYEVTDLGTLGGNASYAYAINNVGQVTGYSLNEAGRNRAFLYDAGVMTDIGTLGGPYSYGYGINEAGQIAGRSYTNGSDGVLHAFLYSDGAMTDPGTLGGAYGGMFTFSAAHGINNAGQVTGFSGTGTGADRAFLYGDGTMTDLGTLGGTNSYGQAINDTGQVTGSSQISGNAARHAFLYTDGAMTDLGTLGGTRSYGEGINNAGQVAGYSYMDGDATYHAFLYDGETMTDLGTLGGTHSRGFGINDVGQVAGASRLAGGGTHAFLYSDGEIIDLNDLIDPLSGWRLYEAFDINNLGQIVGTGLYQGQTRAFLLNPIADTGAVPEPATWAMMIAGFGLVAGAMRRRRAEVRVRYV